MPNATPHVIAVNGIQGSGKQAQAKRLAKALGWEYLSVPELLRSAMNDDTHAGREISRGMRAGERVRAGLVAAVVVNALRQCEDGVVLGGFPRNQRELDLVRDANVHIDVVVQFVVSVKDAMTRLTARRQCVRCGELTDARTFSQTCICGGDLLRRRDDRPEAIVTRLALFDEETQPALNWLDTRGLLVRISGRGDPETVTERMIMALGSHPHTAANLRAAARRQIPALAS